MLYRNEYLHNGYMISIIICFLDVSCKMDIDALTLQHRLSRSWHQQRELFLPARAYLFALIPTLRQNGEVTLLSLAIQVSHSLPAAPLS